MKSDYDHDLYIVIQYYEYQQKSRFYLKRIFLRRQKEEENMITLEPPIVYWISSSLW